MRKTSRVARLILASAAVACLGACSPNVLDIRNAEVSNGKIYVRGSDTPYSGKLTNISMTRLPLGKFKPLLDILGTVTGDTAYSELVLAGSMAALLGNGSGGVLCDVTVKKGVLQGSAQCNAGKSPFLEVTFEDGKLEGEAAMLDPRNDGAVVAQGEFQEGVLDGDSRIYDSKTGKELHRVSWVKGLADGDERIHDASGNLLFEGTLKNGKYEGDAIRYDSAGKVVSKTMFRAGIGEIIIAPPPEPSEFQKQCPGIWASQWRREKDSEPTAQQWDEWKAKCATGDRPI